MVREVNGCFRGVNKEERWFHELHFEDSRVAVTAVDEVNPSISGSPRRRWTGRHHRLGQGPLLVSRLDRGDDLSLHSRSATPTSA